MRPEDEGMESLEPVGAERRGRRATKAGLRSHPFPLRQRGVGETLDTATEILRRRFLLCVGIAVVLSLPSAWMQIELSRMSQYDPEALEAAFVSIVVNFAGAMLIGAGMALVAYRTLRGGDLALGALGRRFLARLPALVFVNIMTTVLIATGFFTCGITLVLFWWKFLFASTITVLESAGPGTAMGRSWGLTRTGFGRWMGIFVVANLYTSPFTFGLMSFGDGTAQRYLQELIPTLEGAALTGLSIALSCLLMAIPAAFLGIVTTVYYVDARVRREALDLELRLARLVERGGRAAPDPAPPEPGGLA